MGEEIVSNPFDKMWQSVGDCKHPWGKTPKADQPVVLGADPAEGGTDRTFHVVMNAEGRVEYVDSGLPEKGTLYPSGVVGSVKGFSKQVDQLWDRYFELAFQAAVAAYERSDLPGVVDVAAETADKMLAERVKRAK